MTPKVEAGPAEATTETPKATKKGNAGARRANVAPTKGKAAKKASPPKKAPKSEKKATGTRDGSKSAQVLELLKRPGGVTSKDFRKLRAGSHIRYAGFCRVRSARRWD